MNLCVLKDNLRTFSHVLFATYLQQIEATPVNYYHFPLDRHFSQGRKFGIDLVAVTLYQFLSHSQSTTVLLENMAENDTEIRNRQNIVCTDRHEKSSPKAALDGVIIIQ